MTRRLAAVALVFLSQIICITGGASALQDDPSERILKLIGDFAERICPRVPLQGSTSTFELSGQAKAELSGLLKKISELGLQGAAKYQQSQFEGVLQKDLLAATRDTTDCRLKVINVISTKLLAAATDPYRLPLSVRQDIAGFVLRGDDLRTQWRSRMGQPEGVQR